MREKNDPNRKVVGDGKNCEEYSTLLNIAVVAL